MEYRITDITAINNMHDDIIELNLTEVPIVVNIMNDSMAKLNTFSTKQWNTLQNIVEDKRETVNHLN